MKNRGLTILEIIIILAIMGIAIPTILAAFGRIVATGADAQSAVVAANLAEEKMEEIIKGKRFSEIVSSGPADFTTPYATYNFQIAVDYVNGSNLDTPVAGPTDFKRVRAITTRDGMTGFNVTLSTIMTYIGY